MWFTEVSNPELCACTVSNEIGRIAPDGTITEFPTGGGGGIAAGPDGNMWFNNGLVGAGVQAASVRAPSVTGSGQQGTQQVCGGDVWTQWAGEPASYSQFSFDGYQWLLDGSAIRGATGQTYTPVVGDIGHVLSCTATVSYPILNVTTAATSAGVTVFAPTSPTIRVLRVLPKKFGLSGRRVGSRCVQYTRANRTKPRCRRPIRVRVIYHLSMPARVSFSIARELTGRRVHARCVAVRRANRHHERCVRMISMGRKIIRAGRRGNNTFTFTGSIGRIHLGPGTYRLTATATAGRYSGKPQRVTFLITR